MVRVLVVDDERVIGKMLETAIRNRGHEARWIDNANDIVKEVEEYKPDVILLDINMPGKSGFEALKELKNSGNRTPVIVISVLSQDFNIEKAYEMGAVDYVIKPFSINYLIRKLEKYAYED